ncbi:MAG: calcium/sodium antiporter [Bacteroidales bacterium]|nr:calcium/sodium antiporter [Bacteroidales bacterium]
MSVFLSILLVIAGLIVLIKGADVLVDQSSQIAKRFNVSERIIGLTLVAFGTSFPELSISVIAAINGSDGIAIGNVVGSNIFNIAVVLGIIALVRPIAVSKSMINKDIPMAILTAVALLVLLFDTIFTGAAVNQLSRADALIFLLFFAVFLYYTFYKSDANLNGNVVIPANAGTPKGSAKPISSLSSTHSVQGDSRLRGNKSLIKNIALIILSLAGVLVGAELVVRGAGSIADAFGMSHVLIGLTIVAMGTSLPEITTGIMAVLKGKDDIAIGNVVGSCMFNVLFILGVASLITPITLSVNILIDVILLIALSVFLFFTSRSKGHISRGEGVFFLVVYVAYFIYIIHRG